MHRLNRRTAAILSGALVGIGSAFAVPAFGQDLLANSGFENPPVPGAPANSPTSVLPTDWTLYGGTTAAPTALRANYFNHPSGGQWSIWLQSWQASLGGFNGEG